MVKGPGVVTGRSGTIGKVHYIEGDYWPHNTTLWVTSFKGNNPRFVYYLYSFLGLSKYLAGSGVPTLNRNDVHQVVVAVPKEPEQRAIAAALSDADALVDSLDALIEKKQAIKQGAMEQLLTGKTRLPGFSDKWKETRIGDITKCVAGGTPNTDVSAYWGGEIPWMASGDLHARFVTDVPGRITALGLENSNAQMLPTKSVLIGLAGQGKTRGTVAMNLVELSTNQSIGAILPCSTLAQDYLYYILDSRYEELRSLSAGDGGRGGLNLAILRSIKLPCPEIAEQTAMAAFLSDMDWEISALHARREKARTVKQGMMQVLLTGKVRLVTPEVTA